MINFNMFFFTSLPLIIYICYTDIRFRKIYNTTIVILLIITIIGAIYYRWQPNWQSALLIFIIGVILFCLGGIGAGDIKLLSVLALSIPQSHIMDFLILTAISGLPLILLVLLIHYIFKTKTKSIPYGIAISTGYIELYTLF